MAIFEKKCYKYTWHGPCDQGYETTEIYYVALRPKSYVVDGSKIKIDIDDDTLIWDVGSQCNNNQCITVRSYMTDEDITLLISSESDDSVTTDILSERDKIVLRKATNDLRNRCKGFMRLKGYDYIVVENVADNYTTVTLLDDKYREVDVACECMDCPHQEKCVRFCDNIIHGLNTKKELVESCIRDIHDSTKLDEFLNKVIVISNEKLFKNDFDLDSDENKVIVNDKKIQLMKLKNTIYGVPCYEVLEIELDDTGSLNNIDLKILFKGDSDDPNN